MHYATCLVWQTGCGGSCDCWRHPPWRIRKEPGELFPWRIWRFAPESTTYEPLMRCSTWRGAMQLVEQFVWLRNNALTREPVD